jgi:hypothetical protein
MKNTRVFLLSRRGFASVLTALTLFAGVTLFLHPQSQSASLTEASVTLSNSRLSFKARLDVGNTVGSSIITIKTTGNSTHTSESTAQIRVDDAITIGTGSYTVLDTNPAATFRTTSGLLTGDNATDTTAYTAQTANLTVRFKTATAITDGSFRLLVPAASSGAADGIPDPGFFDFSTGTPTVQCPGNTTGYTFGSGTAAASSVTIGGQVYHAFTCGYTGAGGVGTDFTTGTLFTVSGIINPAPRVGHSDGVANSHTLLIQHRDSGSVVQDSTAVAVGVIEAVKITATIDPTISFSISGVASSTTKCGVSTNVTTTALEVPFGVLSLTNFVNAAQKLTVSTNGINGYVVTAIANDQLGLNGQTCTGDNTANTVCIRDSRGDNTAMSHTAIDKWDNTSTKGFGYSLAVIGGGFGTPATPFQYNTTSGSCSGGTFCAKHFADPEDSQTPQQIMSHTSVADAHEIDVCYRIIPAVTNAAGQYQNSVTYTATATF